MTMTRLYPYLPSVTVKASALSFGAFATLWILVGLGMSAQRREKRPARGRGVSRFRSFYKTGTTGAPGALAALRRDVRRAAGIGLRGSRKGAPYRVQSPDSVQTAGTSSHTPHTHDIDNPTPPRRTHAAKHPSATPLCYHFATTTHTHTSAPQPSPSKELAPSRRRDLEHEADGVMIRDHGRLQL